MKTFKLVAVVGVFAALSSCGGGSDTASSSTGTTTNSASIPVADCGLPDFKNEVLSRLNAFRASGLVCGTEVMPPTTPVVWNEILQQAATNHASDLAAHDFLSHTGSDGSTGGDRLQRVGYPVNGPVYENAWAGAIVNSVAVAMAGWRNSPAHCKAMMIATNKNVAVSCVANPAANYKFFWVMEIGA